MCIIKMLHTMFVHVPIAVTTLRRQKFAFTTQKCRQFGVVTFCKCHHKKSTVGELLVRDEWSQAF